MSEIVGLDFLASTTVIYVFVLGCKLQQYCIKSAFELFLPARRYASAGNSDHNVSVRLSVCPSVCPSVTRRYCVKTKKASGMISLPSGSPKTLVF